MLNLAGVCHGGSAEDCRAENDKTRDWKGLGRTERNRNPIKMVPPDSSSAYCSLLCPPERRQ